MLRPLVVIAMLLSCTSASAYFGEVKKRERVGAACTGPIARPVPGVSFCAISAQKARIWCPGGQMFEGEGTLQTNVALLRSICNLPQVP
jgi:hypothetical protein